MGRWEEKSDWHLPWKRRWLWYIILCKWPPATLLFFLISSTFHTELQNQSSRTQCRSWVFLLKILNSSSELNKLLTHGIKDWLIVNCPLGFIFPTICLVQESVCVFIPLSRLHWNVTRVTKPTTYSVYTLSCSLDCLCVYSKSVSLLLLERHTK